MKTIKILVLFSLCTLLVVSVAGCKKNKDTAPDSSSAGSQTNTPTTYKDGEYSASAPSYDDSGYKATVKVVIKNGSIYSVDCNADSKNGGTKKAHSESGQYNMKQGGAKYDWHEEIAFFEKFVVQNGIKAVSLKGDGKTDTITGCTIAVSDYVDLINQALEKATK